LFIVLLNFGLSGDGCARVFDVRTGGVLRTYKGLDTKSGERVQASFCGPNEEYVVGGGEGLQFEFLLLLLCFKLCTYFLGGQILFWDSVNSGNVIQRKQLGVKDTISQCIPHPASSLLSFVATSAQGQVTFFTES
jgi:hypothetical protein